MITAQYLRKRVSYDPETGIFTWLEVTNNRVKVGHRAGGVNKRGYRRISFGGKCYYEHRLAFLYMTGEWPKGLPDHKNTVTDDNRWDNLRVATYGQNFANARRSSTNTTGYKGVTIRDGRFVARIAKDGVRFELGGYDTAIEAHAAYVAKAIEIHGEFARAA